MYWVLRIEKSMENVKNLIGSRSFLSNGEPSLRNLSARYQKFGLDFCLGRRRDKTSAGYKCNFHSEPSSALLPVSVRSIERVFAESLLSAELTKPVENNKRRERDRELERMPVEFSSFMPDILCPAFPFYPHDANVCREKARRGNEEGGNRSRIREETMAVGG